MIGNVVYIIVCHYFRENNYRQIETVHATWDGVLKRLQRIKKINRDAGYEVTESENGDIDCWFEGKLAYEYIVLSEIIQE